MRTRILLTTLAMLTLVPAIGSTAAAADPLAGAGFNAESGLPVLKVVDRKSAVGGGGFGGRVISDPNEPGIAEAGTSIKCGNTIYHVYVDGGKCTSGKTSANCSGPNGGKASASCKSGCGTTENSGSCSIAVAK